MDKKKEKPQKVHRFERRAEELRANLKRRKEIGDASIKESAPTSDLPSEKEKQN
ncbi:MAG: hypothetical protein ACKOW3_09215 [Hyphomicrobium sp.]